MSDSDLDAYKASSNGVTIIVKSQDNTIDFSSSARSILPQSVSYSSLYFYLWGKNKITGQNVPVSKADFNPSTDSSTGTISISQLASTSYELYLGATKEEIQIDGVTTETAIANIKSKLYYVGLASADLRYTTQVVFYLTPYGISGFGTVSLKIYFPWYNPADYGYNITVGLYDVKTDAEIKQQYTTTSGVINPTTKITLSSPIATSLPASDNYGVNHINPGTYNLKIIFEGMKKYVWSDTITVFANRETSADICVPDIVLNPTLHAPDKFTAAYSNPSNDADDYYSVEFCWDDNSNNEEYFQLEILDITNLNYSIYPGDLNYRTDVAKILDYGNSYSLEEKGQTWQNLMTSGCQNSVYTPQNYGDSNNEDYSSFCPAGALLVNNTFIVLNLYFGKRYLARLCAKNSEGSSKYAYADLTNACGRSFVDSGTGLTFYSWALNSTSINRYKIKYQTNNGDFYDSDLQTIISSIPLFEFSNQVSQVPYAVMNPVDYVYDSNGNKKATLRNLTSAIWQKWQKDFVGGQDMTSLYDGYKSLNLFAYYDGTNSSAITITPNEDVMIFGGSSENEGVVISGGETTKITYDADYKFTVSRNDSDGYKCLWFYIYNPLINNSLSTRKFIADSISLSVIQNYGLTENYSQSSVTPDVNFPHFFVDISDENKYPAGKWYLAEVALSPTMSPTNKKIVTIRFYITD